MTFTFIRFNLLKLWHYRLNRSACFYAFCLSSSYYRASYQTPACIFDRGSPANSCFSVGKMRGQQMKVWLEQSCSSRDRRRWSGSRHTWPKGCPGPTSTPQTSPSSTPKTRSTLLLYCFAKTRFVISVTQHLVMCC